MNPITGRITSFQPLPLSVLLAGVPKSISAQAEGQLPENGSEGEPALYELTLTLSTDDMTTRQTAGRTSASSQYLWTADGEVPWQLGTSLAVSDWPEGWYEVTARLTCRKKEREGWGPPILLDAGDSMYRIGDPRENQPYGFVRSLSPAETSFTRQGLRFRTRWDTSLRLSTTRPADGSRHSIRWAPGPVWLTMGPGG